MVFASVRERASTTIFLRAKAGTKISLASNERFRKYNSLATSASYILRFQKSIWKSFSLKC